MAEEYIKRESAIEAIENDCLELVYYTKEDAIQCVKAIPAADVAEVVRCKDCKYSGMYCFGTSKEETLACLETEEDGFIRFATSVKADDYCSRGERKMDKEAADDKKQPEEAPGE